MDAALPEGESLYWLSLHHLGGGVTMPEKLLLSVLTVCTAGCPARYSDGEAVGQARLQCVA